MRKIMSTAVAAILLAGAPGSPANAAAGGPDEPARTPRTELTLAYAADAGFAAAVLVTCDPAGGVHPQVKKVCKTLAKVNGDPAAIRPAPAMCTLEYAPITAEITGTWRGQPVTWSKTFSNTCDLTRATGVLFTF